MENTSVETDARPLPVRLRVTDSNKIGTTAFFRNRALLEVLLAHLIASQPTEISVLFHACSLGAEVYSFLIAIKLSPELKTIPIRIAATDISDQFLTMAKSGLYESQVLQGLTPDEAAFFNANEDGTVQIDQSLRNIVQFLPASSFTEFSTTESFDIVFLLNALLYVDGESQTKTFKKVASYNRRWLLTTAFHMEQIEADLKPFAYKPILDRQEEIHLGWRDRQTDDFASTMIPGVTYHPWGLPRFIADETNRYKLCAFFEKQGQPI